MIRLVGLGVRADVSSYRCYSTAIPKKHPMDPEIPGVIAQMPSVLTSPHPCSLTGLPTELLLEVISLYRSSFHLPSPLIFPEDEYIGPQQARLDVLRALSQSCSRLRLICLPFLWERLDLLTHKLREGALKSELCAPWIRAHIKSVPFVVCCAPLWLTTVIVYRSVHISMRRCSANENQSMRVLEIVEFLHTLPNLTALRIYRVPLKMVPILSSAFAETRLPSVTSLSVPDALHSVFLAFPKVTTLACRAILAENLALAPAKVYFPQLVALVGLRLPNSEAFIRGTIFRAALSNSAMLISHQSSHATFRSYAHCLLRIHSRPISRCVVLIHCVPGYLKHGPGRRAPPKSPCSAPSPI